LAVILLVMRNGRTLVFVVAHPDDDAHAMAGTVALQAADPGFRYVRCTRPTAAPGTSARSSRRAFAIR
jgi:LmbE family N-acetylglucosaminyl deacetylase